MCLFAITLKILFCFALMAQRQGLVIRAPNRLLDSSAANMALLCAPSSSFPRVVTMATQQSLPCFSRGVYVFAVSPAIKVWLWTSPGKFSTVESNCVTRHPAVTLRCDSAGWPDGFRTFDLTDR
jgi:hypothetical protein